jgi:hypothetical protein
LNPYTGLKRKTRQGAGFFFQVDVRGRNSLKKYVVLGLSLENLPYFIQNDNPAFLPHPLGRIIL